MAGKRRCACGRSARSSSGDPGVWRQCPTTCVDTVGKTAFKTLRVFSPAGNTIAPGLPSSALVISCTSTPASRSAFAHDEIVVRVVLDPVRGRVHRSARGQVDHARDRLDIGRAFAPLPRTPPVLRRRGHPFAGGGSTRRRRRVAPAGRRRPGGWGRPGARSRLSGGHDTAGPRAEPMYPAGKFRPAA